VTAPEQPAAPAGETWRRVAVASFGSEGYASAYAERFDAVADRDDSHGEAGFVASLLPPGARVLDAGCGTGRVAARLAALGFDVAGVDVDESMVAEARRRWPDLPWVVADLAALGAPQAPYDLVVMAGNVVPFVEPGALPATVAALVGQLRPGGLLVAGFGTDRAHLPLGAPLVPLAAYDDACEAAGLSLAARHAGWGGEDWPEGGRDPGYAVNVHRRRERVR
jgi:SAM-dependent methyltransferase